MLPPSKLFFALFLVFFPFQIRTTLFAATSFDTGNFNTYTSFFLYASDVFLLLSLLFFGIERVFVGSRLVLWFKGTAQADQGKSQISLGYEPFTLLLLLFVALLLASVFVADFAALAFWQSFRFVELLILYFLVVNQVLPVRKILWFLIGGFAFQSVLACLQYIFQGSVGLSFLGEPFLSADTPGVAKFDFGESKIVRAYGTLPHPNVLGGLLVLVLLWGSTLLRKTFGENLRKKFLWMAGIAVLLLAGLLLTFSRSAFLALAAGVLVFFSLSEKKVRFRYLALGASVMLFLVVLFQIQGPLMERFLLQDLNTGGAATERLAYLRISRTMFLTEPFGVGLGHFTLVMQSFSDIKMAPWLLQPVHNVFLLILNEAGVLAEMAFLAIFGVPFFLLLQHLRGKMSGTERYWLFILLTTFFVLGILFLFDHYFWTLYPAQVMLFLYFGFVGSLLKKLRLPSKKS